MAVALRAGSVGGVAPGHCNGYNPTDARCVLSYSCVVWDPEEDPAGNAQHLAQHGITKQEVVEVLAFPLGRERSRNTGRPIVFGETSAGRLLAVVVTEIDAETAYPITAFDIEP